MDEPRKESQVEILQPEQWVEWDSLVAASRFGNVFHYSWWLKATGSAVKVLVMRGKNGELLAGIPTFIKQRVGLKLLQSPPLTPYLGPIFAPGKDTYGDISLQREAGEALAKALPAHDIARIGVGFDHPDVQGFLWAGFSASIGYTYVIRQGSKLENIIHPKIRTEIRKAQKIGLRVESSTNIEDFLALNEKTFKRQGLDMPYSKEYVLSLWKAAVEHSAGHLYLAKTEDGQATDGVLAFSDNKAYYLVMAGGDPELRGKGGGNLVIYTAIMDALSQGKDFDFEGSSLRGVEYFYRRWGGQTQVTLNLKKTSTILGSFYERHALQIRNLLRRGKAWTISYRN